MQLSANDSLWLNMDTPENLMVIESVMWFHHRLDPDAVIHALEDRLVGRYPVFGWRPRLSESIGGRDEWVEDEDFDIHRHVTVHELGGDGGRAELQAFLEARFSEPIDRAHPLWRAYVLEGTDFGAIMIRFHHAIADGTALARVLIEMTTDTPGEGWDYPDVPEDRLHPADEPSAPEDSPEGRQARRKRVKAINAANQVRGASGGRRGEGHDGCHQAARDARPRPRGEPGGEGGRPRRRDRRCPGQAAGGDPSRHRHLRQGGRRQTCGLGTGARPGAGQARRPDPGRDRQRPHARRRGRGPAPLPAGTR